MNKFPITESIDPQNILTTFWTFPLAAVAADRVVLLRTPVPEGAKVSVDCFDLSAAAFPLAGAFFVGWLEET